MSKPRQKISLFIDPSHLADGVIVGVSGGVDSVVLLDLLARRAKKIDGRLIVAHVNYGLREASSEDAEFVKKLCNEWGLQFELHSAVRPNQKHNMQEWARDTRYQFFTQLAKKHHCSAIAVAHNANDQAETTLWHMLRGTGLRGLVNMAKPTKIGDYPLLRPLLETTRKEILNYADSHSLSHREDHTNSETNYTRNAIRHNLLPICEEIHSGAIKQISELAGRLSVDEEYLRQQVNLSLARMQVEYVGQLEVRWETSVYLQEPMALRRRILQVIYSEFVESQASESKSLNADQLSHMDGIAAGNGGEYNLPNNALFVCNGMYSGIMLRDEGARASFSSPENE